MISRPQHCCRKVVGKRRVIEVVASSSSDELHEVLSHCANSWTAVIRAGTIGMTLHVEANREFCAGPATKPQSGTAAVFVARVLVSRRRHVQCALLRLSRLHLLGWTEVLFRTGSADCLQRCSACFDALRLVAARRLEQGHVGRSPSP